MKKHFLLLFMCLLSVSFLYAQNDITVQGQVTDAQSGDPLIGAGVAVKGTTRGTQTDVSGNFTISAPSNGTLIVDYLGYERKEIPINGQTTLDIQMGASATELEQVVVVGYGVQEKKDVTGSIASVDAEEIANRPVLNAEQALQGKVAGVQITSNSGNPGAPPSIRIRGTTSVRSGGGNESANQPLFVVDGVFTNNIQFLSPSDIASIEVLKDASSLAIYGVRGANGVIIVTTKKGRSGKPQISFDSYVGFQEIAKRVDMASADEYVTLLNEAIVNTNPNDPNRFRGPGYDYGQGVNWYDEILQRGFIQDYQLNFAGSTERSSFSISGGYNKQEGIVKGSDYERINFRVNNEYNVSERIKVGANLAVSRFEENAVPGSVFQNAYNADPAQLVRNPSGGYSFSNNQSVANPVAQLEYNNSQNKGGRLLGNVYGELDFLNDFTFRTSFGTDLAYNENRVYVPVYFVSQNQRNDVSRLTKGNGNTANWLFENTLNYSKTFGEDLHNLNVLVGYTAQNDRVESFSGQRSDVPGYDENLWYLDIGNPLGNVANNTSSEFSYLSYLFRTNYSFMDRYLVTLTFRADGSSRFSDGDRWGYFPAVGLGWRMSEEDFIRDLNVFDNLKLRGSYGVVGNVSVPSYEYYARVTNNLGAVFGPNEQLNIGKTETNPTVSTIQWEKIKQLDIGIEAAFLDFRLTVEADYFDRKTEDLVSQIPVSIGTLYRNIGEVQNKGFEFTVGWNDEIGDKFTYGISGNLSTLKNEILSLGNDVQPIVGGGLGNGQSTTRTQTGTSIGEFYGYDVVGIFQTQAEVDQSPTQNRAAPGELKFRDVDGNGVIDDDDRIFLGSPIPNLTYGLNLNGAYGGFDLSIDLQGVAGNKIYNGKKAVRFTNENFEASRLDRWTGPGTSNSEPRVSNVIPEVSSYFIESGSFMRVRTIQLGYTIPESISGIAGVSALRVYLSALNPFTFTDYTGFSPEVGGDDVSRGLELSVIPVTRSFSAGVNVSF